MELSDEKLKQIPVYSGTKRVSKHFHYAFFIKAPGFPSIVDETKLSEGRMIKKSTAPAFGLNRITFPERVVSTHLLKGVIFIETVHAKIAQQ